LLNYAIQKEKIGVYFGEHREIKEITISSKQSVVIGFLIKQPTLSDGYISLSAFRFISSEDMKQILTLISIAREITDRYLETQKELIKSFQSTLVPYVENAYEVFWNRWVSPQRAAEIYGKQYYR
jgi:hypothetical protein